MSWKGKRNSKTRKRKRNSKKRKRKELEEEEDELEEEEEEAGLDDENEEDVSTSDAKHTHATTIKFLIQKMEIRKFIKPSKASNVSEPS